MDQHLCTPGWPQNLYVPENQFLILLYLLSQSLGMSLHVPIILSVIPQLHMKRVVALHNVDHFIHLQSFFFKLTYFNLLFSFHIFLQNLQHLALFLLPFIPTLTLPCPDPSQSLFNYYGHMHEQIHNTSDSALIQQISIYAHTDIA